MSDAASSGTGRGLESSPTPRAWATHAALAVVQIAFASQAVEAPRRRDAGGATRGLRARVRRAR
jgi:hypothetical protein